MKVIDSITIRYFRSVYTLKLDNCKDITVITGKNDVGKSNILKALNLFFNQQSDYKKNHDFVEDYSITRKEEVRKETIRGQQFISITIRFIRGDRMENSLPPVFSVTKRWDLQSSTPKMTTDVNDRMKTYAKKQGIKFSEKITSRSLSTFLNKISYIYIPAIKDEQVFNETLDFLQANLFDSKNKDILDAPIGEANKAVQDIVGELQTDFEQSTGISNFVELPTTLNYTNGLLQVNTAVKGGTVTIDKRGDGIRTHYIPKILNYVANNSKKIYIWGFEEPENSYEYRRCLQVAEEFDQIYSQRSQIFITSHSPAFFQENNERKLIICIGKVDDKTVLLKDGRSLDEELGYIELYRKFVQDIKSLQKENEKQQEQIESLQNIINNSKTPIIFTEGETDTDLLKLAIQKLDLEQYDDWNIQPILSEKTSGYESLLKYLCDLRDNHQYLTMPVIGMFDRDVELKVRVGNDLIDIRDKEFVKLANNIYAFAIPVPHNREEIDQISIEHYFTDSEIKTEYAGKRLFMGNEFYETGVFKGEKDLNYKGARNVSGTIKIIDHESKQLVTKGNGEGDFALSKSRFVSCIENEEPGFKNISFNEFQKIFNIIEKIEEDYRTSLNNPKCNYEL